MTIISPVGSDAGSVRSGGWERISLTCFDQHDKSTSLERMNLNETRVAWLSTVLIFWGGRRADLGFFYGVSIPDGKVSLQGERMLLRQEHSI